MSKYLDGTGLNTLWTRIKAVFVAKEAGKGLSSNDFTSSEKTKLTNIATGAEVNQNAFSHITNGTYTIDASSKTDSLMIVGGGSTSVSYDVPNKKLTISSSGGGGGETYEDATQTVHGLMSTSDKIKLDGFSAASDYALKSDLSSVYKFKGSVATVSALPTNASAGDVYNVEERGINYAWTGTIWDALGELFEIESIDDATINALN